MPHAFGVASNRRQLLSDTFYTASAGVQGVLASVIDCLITAASVFFTAAAGGPARLIIEDAGGADLWVLTVMTNTSGSVTISFPEPIRSTNGLQVNVSGSPTTVDACVAYVNLESGI